MLSIITCSINATKLNSLKKSLNETTFHPFELIAINNEGNKYSIGQAYNIGARQSNFLYLCFVHEDIIFKTEHWDINFIKHFENPNYSLIGILGNTVKTIYPSGVYSGVQNTNRIYQLQSAVNSPPTLIDCNPNEEKISEVAILDGMFLGTTKNHWNNIPFDEEILDGFHGYDIDFSLSMSTLGKVMVVYDILIEHSSGGGNTTQWVDSQLKVIKKWRSKLPIQKVEPNKITLYKREIDDLNQFAITLLKLKYNLKLAFKYSCIAMLRSPFQRINLFFIKHLCIQTYQWLTSTTSSLTR